MKRSRNPVRMLPRQIFALVALLSVLTLTPIKTAHTQEAPSWSYTGSLNAARGRHTATLLPDGKVLVVGGYSTLASTELYDPSTGTWSLVENRNHSEPGTTTTLLGNGKVLVVGGSLAAELYDPATGEWSLTADASVRRVDHTATLLLNGKVLVAGGA